MCLGEEGLEWLIELFNAIFRTTKKPHEWICSKIMTLHKNKADIENCNNYRGTKLLSHTLKSWKKVIE